MTGYIVEVDGAEYVVWGTSKRQRKRYGRTCRRRGMRATTTTSSSEKKILDMGYDVDEIMETIKI